MLYDLLMFVLLGMAPGTFGYGMALLAFWLLEQASIELRFEELMKSVPAILGWFLGNGAVVLGVAHLANLTTAIPGVPAGPAIVALGYLLGFGAGMSIRMLARDESLVGKLQRYLSGEQIEAVLLMLRYQEEDIDHASALMGVTPDRFKELFQEGMQIINRRWKNVATLVEVKNAAEPGTKTTDRQSAA